MAYPISGGEIPRIPSKAEQEQAILENVQKMRRIPQPTPAMEMMYSNVKPIIVYTGKRYVPLPNASEDGKNAKGNVLVMLTPSQNDTFEEIRSDYVAWFRAGYRWYVTDTVFKGKLGRKRIFINNTANSRRNFDRQKFPHNLRYMTPSNRDAQLERNPNVILDLGGWTQLYFQNAFKLSIPLTVQKFVTFLADKLNSVDFREYPKKNVYLPLNLWFEHGRKPLSFRRRYLDNPVTILLFAAYRYAEVLAAIPAGTTFILGDSANDQFVTIPVADLNRANFNRIKSRIINMKAFHWDESSEDMLMATFSREETDEESDFNNTEQDYAYADPRKVIPEPAFDAPESEWRRYRLKMDNRARLINAAKRNLFGPQKDDTPDELPIATSQTDPDVIDALKDIYGVGALTGAKKTKPARPVVDKETDTVIGQTIEMPDDEVDDVTKDDAIYEDDEISEAADEDTIPINIDEDGDLDDAVATAVDETLEELQKDNPDVLLNQNGELKPEVVSRAVQAQIQKRFMPELPPEEKEKRQKLLADQQKIIQTKTTVQRAKSKIIKERVIGDAINTTNEALKSSKYANFDKCYNEQKLQGDIDDAVAALSKANPPVYIESKTEEDTSDQLNLKKTITYTLRDTHNGLHTVKVEVPIVVENNYLYLNGSKIAVSHQLMQLPIVKTGPQEVQIASWFAKMTIRRVGVRDTRTAAVKTFMERDAARFDLVPGNALNKNLANKAVTTLDIDMYARNFASFTMGNSFFILDQQKLLEALKKLVPNLDTHITSERIPVGYNRDTKEIYYVTPERSFTDILTGLFSDKENARIAKMTTQSTRRILRTTVKVGGKFVPVITLLYFFEGFTEVMKKAGILYHEIPKSDDQVLDYDKTQFGLIECKDCFIIWERNPIWNTMLMNGLNSTDLTEFTKEELDERETWANILSNYYGSKSRVMYLLQFYDFMLDPVTIEILEDYHYPTDLVSLVVLANKMLADNNFTPVNSAQAVRIRSNESIAQAVYKEVTSAYSKYRATEYKAGIGRKRPDRIALKPGNIIKTLITDNQLVSEASDLNPILTMEQNRAISPRGPSGINVHRAMTLPKRAYDPSMLGIEGITTSPDYKVGVKRQLTLEPNITSVRGYIKPLTEEEIDSASNANLLTPAELLSPPGVLHDDGPRTAMAYKQSQYMIPVEGSCPVFFGNKVEAAIPYHLDSNFTIVAKEDGKVVEIKDGIVVVEYKSGTHLAIDTNEKMKKNSSGFFVKTQLVTELTKVGQRFKKDEVIAHDPRAFTKNTDDLSASMNIGVPIKVAIFPNHDVYEDASPITKKLSEKFTTRMSMKTGCGIPAASYVESMVDIGDEVEVDDPLIIYDPAGEDQGVNDLINTIRDTMGEQLANDINLSTMPQVRSHYAGTVSAIEVYSSVPEEELSPSLREIFLKYTQHSEDVNATLAKYQNSDDLGYYKCGQLIKNAREPIKPGYDNRIKGFQVGDDGRGLAIVFYIEFKDIAKTGDKGSAYTALKFTTSHVIPEDREAYSEYRPDEEISAIIAPSSVIARKTPSIWETMAANKVLIEMTRHAIDIFFNDADY